MKQLYALFVTGLAACGGSPSTPLDAGTTDGPVADATTDASMPPGPQRLATGEVRPSSLAVFSGDVYWSTDPITSAGQIRKVTPGAMPVTLASNERGATGVAVGQGLIEPTVFWGTNTLLGAIRQIAASGAPPIGGADVGDPVYAVVLDGDAVFAGTRSAVLKKGLGNVSSTTTLASGYANGVTAIAADASGVVFGARTTGGGWVLATVGRGGGTVTTLYTGSNVIRDIALVGSTAYWVEANTLRSVARAGGTPVLVKIFDGAANRPAALVASAGRLYVALNEGVINPSGETGRIVEVDLATGTTRELASQEADPADIAASATHVYWANRGIGENAGQVVRITR